VLETWHFALQPALRFLVDLGLGLRSVVANPAAVLLVGLRFY